MEMMQGLPHKPSLGGTSDSTIPWTCCYQLYLFYWLTNSCTCCNCQGAIISPVSDEVRDMLLRVLSDSTCFLSHLYSPTSQATLTHSLLRDGVLKAAQLTGTAGDREQRLG